MPEARGEFAKQSTILRKIAATDYICDPDGHSMRWHYERKDRPYEKSISYVRFEMWGTEDGWTKRRDAYWEHIESKVREHMADTLLRSRLQDIGKFRGMLDVLVQYLEPLVDAKTGKMKLDPDTGLPLYPLKLPSMEKFMGMYLLLHERVMLLSGEATVRSEQLRPDASEPELNEHLRDRAAIRPKLARADVRAMARTLLRSRAEARAEAEAAQDKPAIDAAGEEADDAASDSD